MHPEARVIEKAVQVSVVVPAVVLAEDDDPDENFGNNSMQWSDSK